jgi:hypothetical protein
MRQKVPKRFGKKQVSRLRGIALSGISAPLEMTECWRITQ